MIKKRKKKSSATGLRIGLRKDVAELQDEFGELDLFTSLRSGDPSKSALLVVTLQRIGIRMDRIRTISEPMSTFLTANYGA
jgi:hypothetical protein